MPELGELEPIKIGLSDRFEEKERIKKGKVVGRTLHIYTSSEKHITINEFLSGNDYSRIRNALASGEKLNLYIWKKENSTSYGVYKAEVNNKTVVSYATSKKLRSKNVDIAKYLGFVFLGLPILGMISDKLKGE